MSACGTCDASNPEGARFCNNCGARLEVAQAPIEERKTVTILFCDVTGSTAMGERLDPESLRRVMTRYFETAQGLIEGHGGTLEKFIGDAVMAVFGVPTLHEDDALRAVRAAFELRSGIQELNKELTRDFMLSLEVRIGINTGEVVTGSQDRLATGDAVNVAARLEQAARPGEILLGGQTVHLVRDAVRAERLEPLELKGKSERVTAYRLVDLRPDQPGVARHLEAPMVGRAPEMQMLRDAYARVATTKTCSLFTVLGTAGVGKSRLVHEFLSSIEALELKGRCLPYGEGITYFPVISVVKQLLGLGEQLEELVHHDPMAITALNALLGKLTAATSVEDIAWAVRKILAGAPDGTPMVIVFDDVHWGEPTFLDLIEHVVDFTRDRAMLVVCMARPELLEKRPGWGGGKLNATTILLEPLNVEETAKLIEQLGNGVDLAPDLRAKVQKASEGNPLFVEEMVAMVNESGGAEVTVPPTIRALLAARLDQLDRSERAVLERGSVEGQSFHRGAVQALAPEEQQLGMRLMGLVRKELVRPDRSLLRGEEAYRFRHLLIRDAAYEALPKWTRARLHESFADWLEEHGSDLVERDEILGYHLEQAYGYRRELGPVDEHAEALGIRASELLATAGKRAMERGDMGAAVKLLERAEKLFPARPLDVDLELDLSWALTVCGRPQASSARLARAVERAMQAGDRLGALKARLALLISFLATDPEGRRTEMEELVEEAKPVFEAAGDLAGLSILYEVVGWIHNLRCEYGSSAEAFFRSMDLSARSGEALTSKSLLLHAAEGLALGPMPIDDALAELVKPNRQHFAHGRWRGLMAAWRGNFEEARRIHAETDEQYAERGMQLSIALGALSRSGIELVAGDPAESERILRAGLEVMEAAGERSWLSTIECALALTLCELGRYEEAESWIRRGLEHGSSEDAVNFLWADRVRGKVCLGRGDRKGALEALSRAVARSEAMEAPIFEADARLDFAKALLANGDLSKAGEQAQKALALYQRKGATFPVEQAQRFLIEVGASAA